MGTGQVESYKVAATLAAQRIVSHVTATGNTVQLPAAAAQLPIGITIDTVLDTTSSIPVQVSGRALLFFNQTVSAGERVGSDSSGRGIVYTAATVTASYVGTLVGPSVDATGTIAEVQINPGDGSTG